MPRPKVKCYCCGRVITYGMWRRGGNCYDCGNGTVTCLPGFYLCDNCESAFLRKPVKRTSEKAYHFLSQDERLRLGDELVNWLSNTSSVFSFTTNNWCLKIDLMTVFSKFRLGSPDWGLQKNRLKEVVRLVKSILRETSVSHRKRAKAILHESIEQKVLDAKTT